MKKLSMHILILILSFILFPGYMFFDSDAETGKNLRWPESFPFIEYTLNPGFASFYADPSSVEQAVSIASKLWYEEGEARFAFGFKDFTNSKQPYSPEVIGCGAQTRFNFFQNKNSIYPAGTADPDCTGSSCTYLWSCNDEILHFDVQFNEYDNRFSLEGESSLIFILSHDFGHAAGLNHCSPGDTAESCSLSGPFTNPENGSVMFRFRSEDILLSEDDRNGIQQLYGKFQNSFPRSGEYALSKDEIQSIATLMTMQHDEGYDTPESRQEQAELVHETLTFVDSGEIDRTLDWVPIRGYNKGMSSIQYFDSMNALLKNNVNSLNDLQLEYMKRNLSSGVIVMDDMLEKYVPGERTPERNTFEYINNGNLDLRKAIIDEQKRREP